VEEGIAITAQEAWIDREGDRENDGAIDRKGSRLHIPKYVQEVIERIAFAARDDKKIDKRSGVSQRLPISAIENVISNAERRALTHDEKAIVPRISDIYAALPAITGKLELEYEGEMKGADFVSRELIRTAVAKAFDGYLHGVNFSQVVQWFDLGGEIQLSDNAAAREVLEGLSQIQGLMDKLGKLNVSAKDGAEIQVSAAEFVLEGLHAHKKIGRNEERVFTAGEKPPKKQERVFEPDDSEFGRKRGFN
jgi:magnesium chelatase subunit I